MPSYTSIILAVQNQIEWSKLCIDSILKNSEGESYELIIVDNGSDEATASYLDSLPATVIHLETNQGLARAWNTGIRKATGRYLVFLHSDVIVPPRWLPNLLAGFDWLPGNLVCVRSTSLIMELDDRYFEWAEELSNQPAGFVSASQIGSCFVLSRSSLFVLGEFDENFKLPPIVSADLTMRIVKMCGSVLIAGNVLTHHFTARTTLDVFAENRDIIKQDVERLARKHKLPEAASDTIRFSMARWLANARELDGPELGKGDERRDDDKTTKTAEAGGAGRIIACVSLYNDLEVLPGCYEALSEVDKIVIVDGAYADFPHSVPSSTDGTLEWIKERRKTDPRIELIECAEAWADEAAKRSAYFVGRDGDWYLHVDADERIVSTDLRPIATLRERLATTVLDGFHLDVETNLAGGKMSLGERYLRIIRHLPGLRYTTTHYMVETDDRFLILDSAKLGLGALYSGFSITHFPSLRAAERQGDKQAYYKKMLVKEVARLRDRIIDAWSQGRRAEHRFLVDQYITRVAMVDDVAKRDLMIDPKYLPYADLSSEVLEAITAVVVPNS